MHRIQPVIVCFALALTWQTAHANGRFPATVNVHVQPGDDQVMFLPATFGLLISRDGGGSFYWVCEEAVGYGGVFDPDYAPASDGSIFATTQKGLRVSRDGGCTWPDVPGDLAEHWVGEVEIGPQGEVWAVTSSGAMPNDVYLSTDNGQTFASKNMVISDGWWKSLRIAPSDGNRLYLTGYKVAEMLPDGTMADPKALFYRSDDGGETWTEHELGDVQFGGQPQFMLEAVDPGDPDVVYARSVMVNAPIGDQLYRSTNGGVNWTKIRDTDVTIRAFQLRKNGDIVIGMVRSDSDTGPRVEILPSGSTQWYNPTAQPQMACVGETSTGELLACGANWDPDVPFALGRSADAENWQKLFRFSELAGAYSCPVETLQFSLCEAKRFPSLCEMFQCAGGSSGTPDAGPTTPPGPDPDDPDDGDSGLCGASLDPTGTTFLAFIAALLVVLMLRPRRTQ